MHFLLKKNTYSYLNADVPNDIDSLEIQKDEGDYHVGKCGIMGLYRIQ